MVMEYMQLQDAAASPHFLLPSLHATPLPIRRSEQTPRKATRGMMSTVVRLEEGHDGVQAYVAAEVANDIAARNRSSFLMPQTCATRSGVQSRTVALRSSKPLVWAAPNS